MRWATKKCKPGEEGPEGFECYATCPNGVTLWRKDLIYGSKPAKPKKAKRSKRFEPLTVAEPKGSEDGSTHMDDSSSAEGGLDNG